MVKYVEVTYIDGTTEIFREATDFEYNDDFIDLSYEDDDEGETVIASVKADQVRSIKLK